MGMISIAQPLPAGNAIRIFVEPPSGALSWRVLRKGADTFTGYDDVSALIAFEGDERVFVDTESLINDQTSFYKAYFFDGSTWTGSSTVSATPSATYEDNTTDAMEVIVDRLRAGLKVEVDRQNILNELGYIQVFTAPPNLERDMRFPLVTVSLDVEEPEVRGIGELLESDVLLDDEWFESEGWIARVQLSIVGWSLNPDERTELRKAIRRIIVANLAVLDDKGIQQVQLSQTNLDSVSGEYDAPVYQTVGTFTCIAPVRVGNRADSISEVEVEANPI